MKNNFFELPQGTTRDSMDVDVLIVGGGASGLSCALRIAKAIEEKGEAGALNIMLIDKASEIGAHSLSGAILNPIALKELIPDFKEKNCPIESEVVEDAVYYLTKSSSFKLPITPPPFKNHGNYIISLAKFNRWLASECEAKGVMIAPGFAAVEVLYDGSRVIGVRTGDKGRDKAGKPKANFEPGIIINAKVTVFAEGTRGSLFKQHAKKLDLGKNKNPDVYEEGVKEVIQCQSGKVKPGQVIHTMGFPLNKSIGGTFLYTLPNDKIILGLVAYLDSKDPLLDPHRELQKLKTHPFIWNLIEGGQVLSYGGKTLPAGGFYSIPELAGPGWLVCGDSANLVDVQKLKGIHLGMKSGMLAAEAIVNHLFSKDSKVVSLSEVYNNKFKESYIYKELFRVRNFHQTLSKGLLASLPLIGIQEITGGRGLIDNMPVHLDSKTTLESNAVRTDAEFSDYMKDFPQPDGKLFFDKLSSVYLTGTLHDEDSPNHLLLLNSDTCRSVCEPKYKSPCTHFCPAAVYEMIPSSQHSGQKELKINYTNCIHCKTCDIKCPFENIDWTPPEGAGGPKYVDV